VERFLIASLGGHFPVLNRDPDGQLAAVVRVGDIHIGQLGSLAVTTSPDGGESWTRVRVVADEGSDMRNPGFGISSKGTWILAYVALDSYENGFWKPAMHDHHEVFIRRSTDKGRTWSEPCIMDPHGNKLSSPFGKILHAADGTLLMSVYGQKGNWIYRSRDDGLTWGDPSHVAEGYNETGLVFLDDRRMLAFLRSSAPMEDANLWQSASDDAGYHWSEPHRVTSGKQHPADIIRLSSGSLLLCFSHRTPPFGVWAMRSVDEGGSWDRDHIVMLTGDSSTWDCGYPSSVQLADGRIYTAFYANDSMGTVKQGERYPVGLHAAGLRWSEDVFGG